LARNESYIGCVDAFSTGFLEDGSQIIIELCSGYRIPKKVVGGKVAFTLKDDGIEFTKKVARIFLDSNDYYTEGVIVGNKKGEFIKDLPIIRFQEEGVYSPRFLRVFYYAHFPLLHPDGRNLDPVHLSIREDQEIVKTVYASSIISKCDNCKTDTRGVKIYKCRRCIARYCANCPPRKDIFGNLLYDYDGCRKCYYIYQKDRHLERIENYFIGVIGEKPYFV